MISPWSSTILQKPPGMAAKFGCQVDPWTPSEWCEACEACEAWGTNFGPVGNHTSSMIWAFFLFTNCLEKKTNKIKGCYDVFLTIWIVGSPHLYPCVTTKCESISVGRMMINGFKLPPPKFIQLQKYGWEKPKKTNDLIVQHVLVLHVNLLESTLW